MNILRNTHRNTTTYALTLAVALFFFFSGAFVLHGVSFPAKESSILLKYDRGIAWDAQINFSEPGGKTDYVVFGEASDANDGPPADSYDVVKPPAPIPPYIRCWFNDYIPSPYDILWKDYRHYQDTQKTWNLSIHWMPPGSSPTPVTLIWNKNKVNSSEYDKVYLINNIGVTVADMITSNSYTFTCPPWVPQTFTINATADSTPPTILNHSPVSGETGDSYIFNATVIDDMTPATDLIVKVNWVHGSHSGNDTMVLIGGNTFKTTVTLDNYTTSPLTYHLYAEDSSKAHNINYTALLTATIQDDEPPSIISTSGSVTVGTGDAVTLWVQATDNVGVVSAKATVDSVDHSMTWNGVASRWEYVYIAPSGSTLSHSYSVTVYDAAANFMMNGPYTISVFDNDVPIIIADSSSVSVGTGDLMTLWVQATDNVGVVSAKATVDSVDHSMTWNGEASRWEYVYIAPSGSTLSHSYTVMVYDAAANFMMNGPYTISVFDNDAPLITNVLATPASQIVNRYVNITAIVTDNINIQSVTVRITGPVGFIPLNVSMILTGGSNCYYNQTYALTGQYIYSIWAKDTSSNQATSSDFLFTLSAEIHITTLLLGWNFIAIPFNQTITKADLQIIHSGVEYTWTEAVTQGLILASVFDWNRSSQSYLLIDTLTPGCGYWVYSFYESELWAIGLNPFAYTGYITPMFYRWNIIGIPANQTINKTTLVVNYLGIDYNWTQATTNQNPTNGPLIVSDIFGWKRTPPQGYLISSILEAGYCYWMYAYYPCVLKQDL